MTRMTEAIIESLCDLHTAGLMEDTEFYKILNNIEEYVEDAEMDLEDIENFEEDLDYSDMPDEYEYPYDDSDDTEYN